MLRTPRRIPIARAVDRELRDGIAPDIRAEKLAAVPALVLVLPLLFDLEHEAARGRVAAPARDFAGAWVAAPAQGEESRGAECLDAPARRGEVAEGVVAEQAGLGIPG